MQWLNSQLKPYCRRSTRLLSLLTVMVLGLPQAGWAQSGGFPAFSPEEAEVSLDSTPQGSAPGLFPATETAQPGRFPVETTSFPISEASEADTKAPTGQPITPAELSQLLKSMGLDAKNIDARHDFPYQADLEQQQIELFFSVELSDEGTQLRLRTWLDPLPQGVSADPLLKLLARNTQMKRGLHYGFNEEARRFLLEKVLDSRRVTAESLATALNEVSQEVASSWALWSTTEWSTPPVKRMAEKPELDSRAGDISGERFEMPIRR